MRFNVAQLLKQTPGASATYDVKNSYCDNIDLGALDVTGCAMLMRTDKGVWASAALERYVELDCSRCLVSFSERLSVRIEEEYFATVDLLTGARVAVPSAAEGSFQIGPDHILDLEEALRQYTLIHQPMKPLCSGDCSGICGGCGMDLNRDRCQCVSMTMDPRLVPLLNVGVVLGEQGED